MVVPFPPGGNTDLMARALQAELSKALNQSVIISNKGGAAGTIGLLDLVKAEPDGYTIALTPNNPITAQPHMQPNLRYGMDTFRYICLTYYTPYVLIAGPQAPFKTFAGVRDVRESQARERRLWPSRRRGPAAPGDALGAQGDRRRRARRAVPGRGADVACASGRHDHGDLREPGGGAGEQSADPGCDLRRARSPACRTCRP